MFHKAKGLADDSVGQRPTKRTRNVIKAEGLADKRNLSPCVMFRKAFSLDCITLPQRRALPCAMIRKGFTLHGFLPHWPHAAPMGSPVSPFNWDTKPKRISLGR